MMLKQMKNRHYLERKKYVFRIRQSNFLKKIELISHAFQAISQKNVK